MSPASIDCVSPRFIAISGGIGGAKLAFGLTKLLPPNDLLVVVNTGDDFEHMGLTICPDIDTVTYTLAQLNNTELGWGRRDESWTTFETLRKLDVENWFQLGDRDLALHLARRQLLEKGVSLSQVTLHLSQQLGVHHHITPMSDQSVRTMIETEKGDLSFQEYFVRDRCEPIVRAVYFDGVAQAKPAPNVVTALTSNRLEAVILCPSNPVLSIDPIVSVPGLREALQQSTVPVIAISPIIAGAAVKGPTVKILTELGLTSTALTCAERYADFLDGYILDNSDYSLVREAKHIIHNASTANTLMKTDSDKTVLARDTLAFIADIRGVSIDNSLMSNQSQ